MIKHHRNFTVSNHNSVQHFVDHLCWNSEEMSFLASEVLLELTLPVLLPCLSVAEMMISAANGSPNLMRGSSHKHLRMLGTSA